ncbi:MAG: protein kinase [Chloroflexota bacterium]
MIKNRYKIHGQLGKGGMGTVYQATDTAVERQVAVKINLNPSPHARRQFEREARLLASLRHTNLPLVTDHFNEEESQYLVMDYVPGNDLSTRVKKEGAQPLDSVMEWAAQLGSALAYLHAQSPPVIHRDIKPANIKITPAGKAVLVDFGIAKASDQTVTTTGARGYTPGYAPPEQYGSASTGPYSDQYAFAATLYALLCGKAPVESIERMLDRETLIPANQVNPKIPTHVNSALDRALSVLPEDRYASIDEFSQSLASPAYKATQPKQALIPTKKIAPEKITKRKIPYFWIGILVLGIIALIVGLNTIFTSNDVTPTKITNNNTLPPPSAISVATATLVAVIPINTVTPSATPVPSPSPAPTAIGKGGLIAFTSNRGDGTIFQIYTMNPDGSNVTQLTFNLTHKSQPTWSPNGNKILFVADGGENFAVKMDQDIWVMDADGANQENLTFYEDDDTDPVWLPDGSKIAFASVRNTGLRQIYYMNSDGSELEFITRGYAVEYEPAWSPDGIWLAFSLSINDAPPTIGLRTGLGLDPRKYDVNSRVGFAKEPAWSPDGEFLVYTALDGGTEEIYIAVFDSKGAELSQLTSSVANRHPDFAPDGQWIVFTSNRDANNEIYVMNVAGSIEINLTNNSATDREPDWQPIP